MFLGLDERRVFMDHYFEQVMEGYSRENTLAEEWLARLPLFLKLVQVVECLHYAKYIDEADEETRARRMKQQAQRPLSELSYGEIDDVFVGMAETARREGILALDDLAQSMAEPFMKEAVQLAVDGTEPDLIMDILETRMESLLCTRQ